MLHYSNWTRDDTRHIAEKVKFGVPILTMLDCEKVVNSAFTNGVSMVCTISQDKAVLYCEALVRVGLKATVEEA
jgi:ATP-dependent Clp protease adapter protein ClpS